MCIRDRFLIVALCSDQRLILFLLVIFRLRLFVLGIDEALSIGFGMVLILLVIDCCVYCFLE